MQLLSPADSTAVALALLFALAGVLQLTGPIRLRSAYAAWGYPRHLGWITGSLELTAAALLVMPATRPVGIALAALVNFTAVVLLLKNGAYLIALPGLIVAAALLVLIVQSR